MAFAGLDWFCGIHLPVGSPSTFAKLTCPKPTFGPFVEVPKGQPFNVRSFGQPLAAPMMC